jgi:hypothetical protein
MTSFGHFQQTLQGLGDVNINRQTLANGQVIQYDDTTRKWVNATGGGGGSSIVGTNGAVVFKDGLQGNAYSDGMTQIVGSAGFAMNVDRAAKRLGINKVNPASTLDVGGDATVNGSSSVVGTATVKTENDTLGIVTANPLRLFSHNLTAAGDVTIVDSDVKKIESSTLVSSAPLATDAPNGTDSNGFYKIELVQGFPQQPGGGLFDQQENYDPLQTQFPTGQRVEYQNSLPLNFPVIIGRTATGVAIVPATVYVITNFGTTFAFQDRCVYDPCQMRSRKQGVGWVWAGAPVQYRLEDTKAMLNVKWYFEGRWTAPSPDNRVHVYVNQFRGGGLLRSFLVAISNNADSCFISGERTFMGHANFGEDINWETDDFQVEIANQAPIESVFVDLAQVEMRFILAQ